MAAVKAILERFGLAPLARLGQHFLVDANVLDKIVTAADPGLGDTILEIGPGLGTMTRALALRAGRVVAVELDRGLLRVLDHTLDGLANVQVVKGDALKLDLAGLLAGETGPIKVVSNLPYYITTPLIFRLLDTGSLSRLVLMVQEEVAGRLTAGPGTPAYGALTVNVAARYRVTVVARVSRQAFYPVPGVDSMVLALLPRPSGEAVPGPPAMLEAVVRAAFGQRRKTLASALAGSALGLERPAARRAAELAGVDAGRRGETLDLDEFERLARAVENLLREDRV